MPICFQKAEEPCGFFPGLALPFCPCSPCSLVMSSIHFLFSSLPTRSCAHFWHRTVKEGQMIDSPCQKVIMRGTAQPLEQLPLQWPAHMACSHLGGSGGEQGPKQGHAVTLKAHPQWPTSIRKTSHLKGHLPQQCQQPTRDTPDLSCNALCSPLEGQRRKSVSAWFTFECLA